jgi:uncharacterized protein
MPLPIRVLFLITFLLISGFAVVYLYRRLVRDVTEKKALRLGGATVILGLAGGSILARTVFRGSGMNQALAIFLGLWIALVLYTLLSLLVVDLARWASGMRRKEPAPVNPERRAFLARAVAGSSLVSGGALASWGVYRAYQPARIHEVMVRLAGLPKSIEGFTIAHLSDLHIGAVLQERYVDDLVSRSNGFKPDLVAITGDLVDGRPDEIGRFVTRLTGLKSRMGTFFVSGNHDHYAGWDAWSMHLTGIGVQVLKNRRVVIGDAGGSFDLLGVEDYGSRILEAGYDPDGAASGRDPARASVLMSHQPGGFDDAVRLNLGLQLSGHTHGGQTFPATGIASLMWGARATGLSREGGSQLFTSRGCGFVGPPMRLGSPSEIIKIVLLPA